MTFGKISYKVDPYAILKMILVTLIHYSIKNNSSARTNVLIAPGKVVPVHELIY